MKKLKLKAHAFQGNALSREQLKKVLGGVTGSDNGGCPEGQKPCTCTSDAGTVAKCVSSVQDCWDAC